MVTPADNDALWDDPDEESDDTLLATSWSPPSTKRYRVVNLDADRDEGQPSRSRVFDGTEENAWPPQPSHCEQCGWGARQSVTFNENPWAQDRGDNCPRCGAGRHWESPSHYDWLHIPRSGRPAQRLPERDAFRFEAAVLAGFPEQGFAEAEKNKANLVALSKRLGISKSSLYRWRQSVVGKKSQYDGGTEMSATEMPTLAQTVNVDHEVRICELERQVGLPPGGDRAAEQAVDHLIEDSLGGSTHERTDDA